MLRAYPHETTVDAGGQLRLHVLTDATRYWVRLERWNNVCDVILEAGPYQGDDVRIIVPATAPAGAYVARFRTDGKTNTRGGPTDTTPDARWGTALFVVRAPSRARVLVNLPLFTYHAYNVAHVDGTLGAEEGECLYSGFRSVSLHRPGGGTGGHPWDEVNADAYDATSPRQTFAHWDLPALAWFAREGIAVDVCTDLDLHRGDAPLERYALLCSFGHNEYWTRETRAHVEAFLEEGGNVGFFGGNTCWFRVRYDEASRNMTRDGKWSDDDPEDALTGLSFRCGGGKWKGDRPPAGYTVENAAHPLLANAGLQDGDVVRAAVRVIGYECDGVDPKHAPPGLTILARASLAHWDVTDGGGDIVPSGHAAMVTFARGAGRVVNVGSTDWSRARDRFTDRGHHAIRRRPAGRTVASKRRGVLPAGPSFMALAAQHDREAGLRHAR